MGERSVYAPTKYYPILSRIYRKTIGTTGTFL